VADLSLQSEAQWGYLRLFRMAAVFVAGMEVGLLLTPAAFMGWQSQGQMIVFWLLFTVLVWIWLIQVRALGRLVVGACSTGEAVSWIERGMRGFASFQLGLLIAPAMTARFALHLQSKPAIVELLGRHKGIEGEFVIVLQMSVFIFLTLSFVMVALTSLFVFSVVALWLAWRNPGCQACGQRHGGWRTVGRTCGGCGTMLAPWLYLGLLEKELLEEATE
jgi:hypothetical protein